MQLYQKQLKKRQREEDEDLQDLVLLTQEEEKWNKQIRLIRQRVESPFGIIKGKWGSLKTPFAEDEHQLDSLVKFALGVYNRTIKK